jgi:hypothetical protein
VTTADWALVLSILSFFVALAGFVWNVWSKFIYPKAKVRSHIGVYNGSPPRKTISLSATNYGPTEITLHIHLAKRQRQGFLWFRSDRHFAVMCPVGHPDTNNVTGLFPPGFPKKLAVGEGAKVYFSPEAPKRWVEEDDLFYFGFSDTFGRYHWCSRANAKEFRKVVIAGFGAVPPVRPSVTVRAKAGALHMRQWCMSCVCVLWGKKPWGNT